MGRTVCSNGIGVPAPSKFTYELKKNYKRFVTEVGTNLKNHKA